MTRPETPWDDASAGACGIAWLLAETEPAGAFGRAARARERVPRTGDEAAAARAIAACAALAARAGAATLAELRREIAGVPDIVPATRRARAGEPLADADAYEALRFAVALRAIAGHARARGIALAAALDLAAFGFPAALAPGATAGGGFYLADAFDSELAAARDEANTARTRADLERSRIDRDAGAFAARTAPPSGEFVVMRDRVRGPLPRSIRVIREAPTYLLCETVLDDGALAAASAFADAERVVSGREDAVRGRLAAALARDADAVAAATEALGDLDLAVAKAAFAARYDTCVPEISERLELVVTGARFLPLASRAEAYVPLDLELGRASVLTGPNMGGKTTALRTAGFVAACVLLGLPVPARGARVSLFARIAWAAPSEPEAPESGLSAFGAEIVRVRELFEAGPARALVLVDEFARTTTPREGRALLVALIEGLRDAGALVFAATHAGGVAAAAGATPLAVAGLREPLEASAAPLALDDALVAISRRMDFRIVRVESSLATRSDAIALARALGFDAALADRAETIVRETPA